MCEVVCGSICGEKYEEGSSCFLRWLVLFYSELRLEKIVLQCKVDFGSYRLI